MKLRRSVTTLTSILLLIAGADLLWAHRGTTDFYGGHSDKRGYHFHSGPLNGKSFSSKTGALKALREAHQVKRPKRPARPIPPEKPDAVKSGKDVALKLEALVNLLIEKKVITAEELEEGLLKLTKSKKRDG